MSDELREVLVVHGVRASNPLTTAFRPHLLLASHHAFAETMGHRYSLAFPKGNLWDNSYLTFVDGVWCMEIDSEDQSSERTELHFLAALVDELMKALLAGGVMTRTQLQEIEEAVSTRLGSPPRAW